MYTPRMAFWDGTRALACTAGRVSDYAWYSTTWHNDTLEAPRAAAKGVGVWAAGGAPTRRGKPGAWACGRQWVPARAEESQGRGRVGAPKRRGKPGAWAGLGDAFRVQRPPPRFKRMA